MDSSLAIGVIDEGDLQDIAAAVGDALGVDLHERYGLHIGGGRYFSNWSLDWPDPEIHVVSNFGPDEAEWKYPRDQDVPFIVHVWPRKETIDAHDVLGRLSKVVASCRLLARYDA